MKKLILILFTAIAFINVQAQCNSNQEAEVINSLKIINNHFLLKNKDKTYLDINEYLNKYDVNDESNKFKRFYKDSAEEDREKTFKNLRSDHPMRRDVF